MTTRALTLLIAAVLIAGGAVAVIASSLGESHRSSSSHVMPNGQTMQGDSMDASER